MGGYSQGYGGPLNMPSSAVDSLFGPPRGRAGPAPGFGQQGGQQDMLFGLGGKGGLDSRLGDMGRLGLSDNRLSMGLGDRLFDQKQNHPGHHLQDSAGFTSKDWQVSFVRACLVLV